MRTWGLTIKSREEEDVKANFMTFLQTTFGGERGVSEREEPEGKKGKRSRGTVDRKEGKWVETTFCRAT